MSDDISLEAAEKTKKNGTFYVAFDVESGSLSPKQGDLLSAYFAILDEDYKVLEELELKLKPDNRLPIAEAQALAVNKIDIQKHLEDPATITYKEGHEKLVTLLKKYHKKTGKRSNLVAFGYNILGFDIGWLQEYLMPVSEWNSFFHYKSVDVMQAVDFLKRVGWFPKDLGTLVTVVDYLGISKLNAHEAKNDVVMTIEVDKKLTELMKSKRDGGSVQDLVSLLESE